MQRAPILVGLTARSQAAYDVHPLLGAPHPKEVRVEVAQGVTVGNLIQLIG